jgi:transposase-like protein
LQLPLRPPFLTPCACAFDRSREDRKWRKAGRVKGRWKYLCRAIDKGGATLDCFLADRRNAEAAKRFLSAALKRSRDWIPRVINTDKNPAYGEAIAELSRRARSRPSSSIARLSTVTTASNVITAS